MFPSGMKWIKIFSAGQIPSDNSITKITAAGRKICIIRWEGKFYATQAYCPHAGADLSGGWCGEGKLICPYHRYSYDLKTGRGSEGQGDYLNTYPIEIRKEGLFVAVPEKWRFLKKLFRL